MRIRTYLLWLLPCFFVVIQFFQQNVANIFASAWMQQFHLSPVSLANLSSAYFYTYALMQIPAGLCYDKFSSRALLTVSLTMVGLACISLGLSQAFSSAFIARLMIGAASSFAFVGMLKITSDLFSNKQFPLMIGISEMLTMSLVSLAMSAAAFWFIEHSWQSIQYITAAVSLLLALACLVGGHAYPSPSQKNTKFSLSLSDFAFLREHNAILGSLYCLLAFSIVSAFTSLWGIQFLVHTQQLTMAEATHINGAILIGIAIGSLFWGSLAKQTGYYRGLLLIASACSFIILSLLLVLPPIPYHALYVGYFLAGVACAAYIPCLALIKQSVTKDLAATAMAFANMMIMLGAPLFQMIIAFLIAHPIGQIRIQSSASYQVAMMILPLTSLLAWILSYYLKPLCNPLAETLLV